MSYLLLNASSFGVDKRLLTVLDGYGLELPQVVSFVAIDSRTVRATFSHAMWFHATKSKLLKETTYAITRDSDGAALPILRLDKISDTVVELTTVDQGGVAYTGSVTGEAIDAWGNAIDPAACSDGFTGIAATLPTATWMASMIGLDAGIQAAEQIGFLPDLDPPYISYQSPAPYETSVSQTKVIVVDVKDDYTGVDVATVKIWIEGSVVWESDAAKPGWSGTRTPIASGYRYQIAKDVPYPESETVIVRFYAKDAAKIPNVLDETWQFVTVGTAPLLENRDPAPGETDVDPARHVWLDIVDPDSGVNESTIWIKLNGVYAWNLGAPGVGFTVNKTTIVGGFRFDIVPPGGKLGSGPNAVWVYAKNNAENPLTLNTGYSFIALDVFPPYLSGQDPAPGAIGVETTRPVALTFNDDVGVVLSSIRVYIRDELVFNGTSFTAGWLQSFYEVGGVNGFSLVCVPDPDKRWREGEVVRVSAIASDTSGGSLSSLYDFSCGEELFPFSSYRFVLQSIREMDKRSPGLLQPIMEEGIDDVWLERIFNRLTELQATIYDPAAIDPRWLPWLKAMVGFGRDLEFQATEHELRKILLNASLYWDEKPTELGIRRAIRLVTGNHFRIRDWFDLRFMVDEATVAEQLQDFDCDALGFDIDLLQGTRARSSVSGSTGYPWDHIVVFATEDYQLLPFQSEDQYQWLLIKSSPLYPLNEGVHRIEKCVVGERYLILRDPLPSRTAYNYMTWTLAGGMAEFTTEVRLVDELTGDGAVNRALVRFLVEQVRQHGERIDLVYTAFLDEFVAPGELDQWTVSGSVTVPDPGGEMVIAAGAKVHSNVGTELAWYDQSPVFRLSAAANAVVFLKFWRVDDDNCYWVRLDINAHTVQLWRRIAGASSQLGSTITMPYVIAAGVPACIRVDALTETPGVRLRVKVNGETQIDVYGAPPTVVRGGVGVDSFGAATSLNLVEVMTVPVTVERVGPNP